MKIRLCVSGVSFYTNVSAIKRGVGDTVTFNEAVRQCYDSLKRYAAKASPTAMVVGHSGSWNGYSIQMDFIKE